MAAGVLVIGYGNTLRGDDGLGPAVAEEIAALGLPGVRVLVVQQLTPELAAELAAVRRVVFVDAAVAGEPVAVVPLSADDSTSAFTHAASPQGLLALARAVYRLAPEAWLVTITGDGFGYREGLSEPARARARLAAQRIRHLIPEPSDRRSAHSQSAACTPPHRLR